MTNDGDLYRPKELKQADKWREAYNPLVGLNLRLVVAWLYNQQLGIVSDIAWLYRFAERRYPVLTALILRRTAAMEKLDWSVRTMPEKELPEGYTQADADKQALELRNRYDQLDNVNAAIRFLAMAPFRGYSHLEKHLDAKGNVTHLEPVPQWNWARAGLFGDWYYNQGAFSLGVVNGSVSPQLTPIDETDFLIREVEYPIDEIAVINWLRENGSKKDWDGFIATYGIPPLFIELPPDAPAPGTPEASAYQKRAEQVASDSRGVMPNGAKAVTLDAGSRGKNPFLEHIRYNGEEVVLVGTGGKLTMMTESGSGTLAGGAHQEAFDEIAEAEAKSITEVFQAQFDQPILTEKFPGQPVLAYFTIEAKELTDTSAVVEDVLKLAQGGYEVDLDQIEEKTGYRLSVRPPVNKAVDRADAGNAGIQPDPPTENRLSRGLRWLANRLGDRSRIDNRSDADMATDALFKSSLKQLTAKQAAMLKPLRDRLKAARDGEPEQLMNRLRSIEEELPALLKKMNASPATAKIFSQALAANYLNGRIAAAKKGGA